ncbi:MAG: hypothetical protein ACK4MQ_10820 [Hyphomonas sp.]
MHEIVFSTLTDTEREVTRVLAMSASRRLERGEGLADMPLVELRAFCIVAELNLTVALVELSKRDAPAEGRLQ